MSFLQKLGLVVSEDGEQDTPVPVAVPAAQQSVSHAIQPTIAGSIVSADTEMVERFMASAFGGSELVEDFVHSSESRKMHRLFPNDPMARLRAALAATDDDCTVESLVAAMQGEVAQALVAERESAAKQLDDVRAAKVGTLEAELTSIGTEIENLERQIEEMRQTVSDRRARSADLQSEIRNGEAELHSQDQVVQASLDEAGRRLANFAQSIKKLGH